LSFWLPAFAIPLAAALVLCWPLLRRGSQLLGTAVPLLLLIPVSTLFLYQFVGTPEGIEVSGTPHTGSAEMQMDELVIQLRTRLEQQPGDLDGWMLLARSYKTMQRYDDALGALQRAHQLAPDDPRVSVELAEAMIFTSGSPRIDPGVRAMIESAVERQPDLQKGLWLLGIIAFQDQDYAAALAHWERLLPQLDPASGAAQAVRGQMDEARARLGLAPEAAWAGLETVVQAPPGLGTLPDGAVLFLIARDPNAPMPPLGAVRVPAPVFPVTVPLSDANSMVPQRPISGVAVIEVVARLSYSGQPTAQPGDPVSEPVRVETVDGARVELLLAVPDS